MKRSAAFALAAALALAVPAAQALEIKPYSAAALAEAEQHDQPVALHFRADWCPICRAQDIALKKLQAEPGLDLTVLSVNYDTEKSLMKRFHVEGQSTLVVLHGTKERARALGDVTPEGLRATLKKAL